MTTDARGRAAIMRRFFTPRITCLVFCAALLTIQDPALTSVRISADGDLAQHLTLGRLMLEGRAILAIDPTLYTVSGVRWIGHEWLTQVIFALLHARLGLIGPVILVSVVVALALAMLVRELQDRTQETWAALAVFGLAAPLLAVHLLIRPHVVTWLLAVLWQRSIRRWMAGELSTERWLLVAAPVMVLWCNLHGGFTLGFVLLGIQGAALSAEALFGNPETRRSARDRLPSLGIGTGVVFVASGINPFFFGLHTHILRVLSGSSLLHAVIEFKSPDFFELHNKPLLLWILASFALAAASGGGALKERLTQLVFIAASLQSQRNAAILVLLTAPTVATDLARVIARGASSPGPLGAPLRALSASSERLAALDLRHDGRIWGLVLFVLLANRSLAFGKTLEFAPELQPVAAVRYIREHEALFQGRMFNTYEWGGYLAYSLYPAHRCFASGMADYYGPALFDEYTEVAGVRQDWERVLDKYRVDWVLFRSDTALARILKLHSGWRELYRDERNVIFIKVPRASAGS